MMPKAKQEQPVKCTNESTAVYQLKPHRQTHYIVTTSNSIQRYLVNVNKKTARMNIRQEKSETCLIDSLQNTDQLLDTTTQNNLALPSEENYIFYQVHSFLARSRFFNHRPNHIVTFESYSTTNAIYHQGVTCMQKNNVRYG